MSRILVVEDDTRLLELTAEVLRTHAEVDCASQTAQALRLMVHSEYDLLVTDLNIEHAGDGLILAGAMRSLHPRVVNVLITGYPNFTGALAAMQATLDHVLVKPIDLAALSRIHGVGRPPRSLSAPGAVSLKDLLTRQSQQIVAAWLKLVEADPQLASAPLSTVQRLDHMVFVVEGLLRLGDSEAGERASAQMHGRQREKQYPSPDWVSLEVSYLRRAIFDAILRELLDLDLSSFPGDLFELNLRLDTVLFESLRSFGLQRK